MTLFDAVALVLKHWISSFIIEILVAKQAVFK